MENPVSKPEIRRRMRLLRRSMSQQERARVSAAICAKLLADPATAHADVTVAVYIASQEEIDLSPFIREMLSRGSTVAAPRWNGMTYDLAKVRELSAENLRPGPMGILEPREADLVTPEDVDLWIVPGLAFTADGKRVGYGGGWYDRLLSASSAGSLKVGVACGFQIVDDIPADAHDIQVDRVVTDAS